MKTNKLKIQRIECNSTDKQITVFGEIFEGVLSFPTKIDLPLYWFNVLLNHLQDINSSIRIHDYIDVIDFPKGVTQYELSTKDLIYTEINWDIFTGSEAIQKKIGA